MEPTAGSCSMIQHLNAPPSLKGINWIAVDELKLTYHNGPIMGVYIVNKKVSPIY